MSAGARPATTGDLCTCGRQAVNVTETERFGDIGWCGSHNVTNVAPCPFCGQGAAHEGKCSRYVLRPTTGLDTGYPLATQ